MDRSLSYLSNAVISNKNEHINNYLKLFTQLDVKQLMIFGRTFVAASDLKNCTMVNCDKVAGNVGHVVWWW